MTAAPGAAPECLADFFPPDEWLLLVDESHVAAPQIKGMFEGDRRRKSTLVEHGFRLPSALDNRPLRATEFWRKTHQAIFVSATPGKFERELCLAAAEAGPDPVAAGAAVDMAVAGLTVKPDWGPVGGAEGSDKGGWWDAEAVIRPTGVVDPPVRILPSAAQVFALPPLPPLPGQFTLCPLLLPPLPPPLSRSTCFSLRCSSGGRGAKRSW